LLLQMLLLLVLFSPRPSSACRLPLQVLLLLWRVDAAVLCLLDGCPD
jgi:hypothetical protein